MRPPQNLKITRGKTTLRGPRPSFMYNSQMNLALQTMRDSKCSWSPWEMIQSCANGSYKHLLWVCRKCLSKICSKWVIKFSKYGHLAIRAEGKQPLSQGLRWGEGTAYKYLYFIRTRPQFRKVQPRWTTTVTHLVADSRRFVNQPLNPFFSSQCNLRQSLLPICFL